MSSTVPTEDQILVPETLLKKRKSQEKEREARSAELEKKKKVCALLHVFFERLPCADTEGGLANMNYSDDTYL